MEPEQTCVHKPFHGADHLGDGKHCVTAAAHVMVVQKWPCAVLGSIRKGNGLRVSHKSTDWNISSRTCLSVFWPWRTASDQSAFIGVVFRADSFCGASLWSLEFSCSLNFSLAWSQLKQTTITVLSIMDHLHLLNQLASNDQQSFLFFQMTLAEMWSYLVDVVPLKLQLLTRDISLTFRCTTLFWGSHSEGAAAVLFIFRVGGLSFESVSSNSRLFPLFWGFLKKLKILFCAMAVVSADDPWVTGCGVCPRVVENKQNCSFHIFNLLAYLFAGTKIVTLVPLSDPRSTGKHHQIITLNTPTHT